RSLVGRAPGGAETPPGSLRSIAPLGCRCRRWRRGWRSRTGIRHLYHRPIRASLRRRRRRWRRRRGGGGGGGRVRTGLVGRAPQPPTAVPLVVDDLEILTRIGGHERLVRQVEPLHID